MHIYWSSPRKASPQSLQQRLCNLSQHWSLSSHCGQRCTYKDMQKDYFWPNMADNVYRTVSSCHSCGIKAQYSRTSDTYSITIPHEAKVLARIWRIKTVIDFADKVAFYVLRQSMDGVQKCQTPHKTSIHNEQAGTCRNTDLLWNVQLSAAYWKHLVGTRCSTMFLGVRAGTVEQTNK